MNEKEILWKCLFVLFVTLDLVIGVDERIPSGQGKVLLEGEFTGPETIVSYGDYLYTGVSNGKILKIPRNGNDYTSLPDIPGARRKRRFNGLRIYNDILYALDASNGIYSINLKNGEQREILSSYYDNGTTKYLSLDCFDIDLQTGTAYISVASQRYDVYNIAKTIESNESSGIFLSKNMNTNKEEVILDKMFLPNGVQMTYENDSVLVSETNKYRLLRYFIRGPKRGKWEDFAYVPGQPDNVRLSSSGGYWTAIAFSGNHTVDSSDAQCVAVELDRYGKLRKQIETSESFNCSISDASEHFGSLFIGSNFNSFIVKIDQF